MSARLAPSSRPLPSLFVAFLPIFVLPWPSPLRVINVIIIITNASWAYPLRLIKLLSSSSSSSPSPTGQTLIHPRTSADYCERTDTHDSLQVYATKIMSEHEAHPMRVDFVNAEPAAVSTIVSSKLLSSSSYL